MSFVAKGGRVVTDDMLDKWADDADNGEFGGRPGAVYSGPVVPVAQYIEECETGPQYHCPSG